MTCLSPELLDAIHTEFIKFQPGQSIESLGWRRTDVEQVFLKLASSYGPLRATRYLDELIKHLGDSQQRGAAGLSVVRLKQPSARVTVAIAEDMKCVHEMDRQLRSLIPELHKTGRVELGHVLYSAIRYGGLLKPRQQQALLHELAKPNPMAAFHQEMPCFYFSLPGMSQEQRWAPDVFTAALIAHWVSPGAQADLLDTLKTKNRTYWQTLLRQAGFKALSPARLVAASAALLALEIPAALVDCARGVHDSRSLHPIAYRRLLSNRAPLLVESKSVQASRTEADPAVGKVIESRRWSGKAELGTSDTALLRDVGRILRNRNASPKAIHEDILACLEKYAGEVTPVTTYLCEWIGSRLTNANRWGNKFARTSAYTRLRSIARRLRGWLGVEDPLRMPRDRLIEIYEEVMDEAATSMLRTSIGNNLRDFQAYLEDHYGADSLSSDAPWSDLRQAAAEVDAKVLWPWEYQTLTDHLHHLAATQPDPQERHLWRARLLVLVLGYRCGLRRREILYLRQIDIAAGKMPELLVRPHYERSLKSSSANRRIPIDVLLSPDELNLLKTWMDETPAEYLLAPYDEGAPRIAEELIFSPIQALMQQVTGDPNARFHHLRHSFATLNFWRWMLLDSESPIWAKGLFEDWMDIPRQRQRILELADGRQPSSKVLHALAMMIGHSGPSLTLAHYIHCADLMFEQLSASCLPSLSHQELAMLAGVGIRQIQKKAKQGASGFATIESTICRRLKPLTASIKLTDWQPADTDRFSVLDYDRGYNRTRVFDIWSALLFISEHDASMEEAADRFNLFPEEVSQASGCASALLSIRHDGRARKSYRHRAPEWQQYETPPLFYPVPRQRRHLDAVRHIVRQFEQLEPAQRREVMNGIFYYLHRGKLSSGDIPFTNREALEAFLPVYDILDLHFKTQWGASVPRYRVVLKSQYEPGSSSNKECWNYWKETKGLVLKYTANRKLPSHAAPYGKLCLRYLSVKPKRTEHHRSGKKVERQSDWGFRLGLYLIAVCYGVPAELAFGDTDFSIKEKPVA